MGYYVGSCVDCFDEDGDCIEPALPWATVSDFARVEEGAAETEADAVRSAAWFPGVVSDLVGDHAVRCSVTEDGVTLFHDTVSDVHYFFVGDPAPLMHPPGG